MTRSIILSVLLSTVLFTVEAQVFDAVIAQDGSGTHTTISTALRRLSAGDKIFIKNGVYQEKVVLGANLDDFSVIGESQEGVIIEWDDHSGDSEGHSTATSYTVLVTGDNVYMENLTIRNTAGDVGQAVALNTEGDQQIFKNVKLEGFQDTYYVEKGKQYNLNCEISGATDFIFGDATAVFQSCDITCVDGGQYITAPADTKLISQVEGSNFYHGILFLESNILAGDGVGAEEYYLGRPWQHNSSSVYINCVYEDHVRAKGWSEWNDNTHNTAVFAEYGNTDTNGNPIDVSARADWSIQLSAQEVDSYYNLNYFLDGWDPVPATVPVDAPTNLAEDPLPMVPGMYMWDEVAEAIGYVVYIEDSAVAIVEDKGYGVSDDNEGKSMYVRAVSPNGSQSGPSNVVEIPKVLSVTDRVVDNFSFVLTSTGIEFKEAVSMEVYSLSGQLMYKEEGTNIPLKKNLNPGLYVLRFRELGSGRTHVLKLAL